MKQVGIFTRTDIHNEKLIHYIPSDLIYKLETKVKIKLIVYTHNTTFKHLLNDISTCDGIIFPGGDELYLIEQKIIKHLYDNDIPTLGICLGMQEMALTFNGELKEIYSSNHNSKNKYVHDVIINRDTKLYKIIGKRNILVNSRHKDFVQTNLKISAISYDNIIEAIEDPSKKFFIGVQWHPENLNDKYSNRLFSYFISML